MRRAAYGALAAGAALVLAAGLGLAARGAPTAQTFRVDVDGHNAAANEAFLAYFPRTVTVHPGDTVVFHNQGNGEPHTATLGTLVDGAVSAYDALTPAQKQASNPPKAFQAVDAALPQLLPQGPGDAVQSAANPCYVRSGGPGTALCPRSQHEQPAFDGVQTFYNSGWLDSKATWSVHLSPSTAPGTYRFMCLLHRESMSGRIVVVPSGTAVQSPSAQYAAGQRQLAAVEAKLQPAAAALKLGQPPVPGLKLPARNAVLAGSGSPSVPEAEITQFGPRVVHVPVGGSVTWFVIGPHTISFGTDKTNDDIRAVAPDGTVHLNGPALAPAGTAGEPPPTGPPASGSPNAPPRFKTVASATWNGRGHLSSGIFLNSFGPPVIEGFRVTFTRAGRYSYLCTVHDGMKGEVDVG